ncbi:hypothetical protein SAMN00808754_0320 [Thermanaeromonas toyohensis ToBE]|uniref:Uncharacterized protein n=1 Tax=Thermanaeromonas toyohensis ToBE TaxID=698762 RepID=A0A1W1VBH7_9FIRM|nr:hypothetical protein [Thermanaeromonas toyohensis]SMB90675.1 hypothetical protein SAMN00808754_0320 [Thermanaeromonas toyohensis ToBE]
MLNWERLKIATLNENQLEKLKEAEQLLNTIAGTDEIYLIALSKK